MENTSPCTEAIDAAELPSRRTVLRVLTGLFGAVAATVLSIPMVGYFFGVRKRTPAWIDLGGIADFPLNETRRLTFDNSMRQPWDGMTALTIVYARYQGTNDGKSDQFLVLSANWRIWVAPSPGSNSRACSCAHAMAACTTPTASTPPAHRHAACTTANGESTMAGCRSNRPITRHFKTHSYRNTARPFDGSRIPHVWLA